MGAFHEGHLSLFAAARAAGVPTAQLTIRWQVGDNDVTTPYDLGTLPGDAGSLAHDEAGAALAAAAAEAAASATAARELTRGFKSFATASARRKVSSKTTPALFRIADCRAAYSSMRSARYGE